MPGNHTPAEQLCLDCALCCSGALHSFTYLQPEELAQAQALGLAVVEPAWRKGEDQRPVFRQPCRALDDSMCRIYAQRPRACQAYICHVLERLQDGDLNLHDARMLVTQARQLIDQLRQKMPHPAPYLSLSWEVRVNWPRKEDLSDDAAPIFQELAVLLAREWKVKWQRTVRRRR